MESRTHYRVEPLVCRYAVSSLQWLGVRSSMLADAADDAWQPLTQRDAALISTLRFGPLQVCPMLLDGFRAGRARLAR